jgi:preprotein translocase subunit YajC
MGYALAIGWLVVVGVVAYLFMIRPQRQSMAAHLALLEHLSVGDEVVTAGGVYGTIRALQDDVVELEVAAGVTVKLARGAVARLATPERTEPPDRAVTADVPTPSPDEAD